MWSVRSAAVARTDPTIRAPSAAMSAIDLDSSVRSSKRLGERGQERVAVELGLGDVGGPLQRQHLPRIVRPSLADLKVGQHAQSIAVDPAGWSKRNVRCGPAGAG
jgi:hypothetical protein